MVDPITTARWGCAAPVATRLYATLSGVAASFPLTAAAMAFARLRSAGPDGAVITHATFLLSVPMIPSSNFPNDYFFRTLDANAGC
jgi:hypothetical protein